MTPLTKTHAGASLSFSCSYASLSSLPHLSLTVSIHVDYTTLLALLLKLLFAVKREADFMDESVISKGKF
ncbi:hypothetical protein ACTXT7_014756 [Hymenolepis weldensis]